MKRIINLKRAMVSVFTCVLVLGSYVSVVKAQCVGVGTCTVLHQPCIEYDGVLVTNITSGLTPPLTFTYYGGSTAGSQSSVIHSNVNALTDTLKGTQGCASVYVTDNSGHCCSITNTGMITPFSIDYPTVTSAVCPANTGTAKITINSGTLPDSVKWYKSVKGIPVNYMGSGDPMSLPVGSYIALVSAKGCRAWTQSSKTSPPDTANGYYSMINITSTSNIKITTASTDASCTNGTASVTGISGGVTPYTYHWSTGATTPSINNLSMGSYPVTVTDAQGCYTVTYIYIRQTPTITVTPSITKPTCLQNDGSVLAFASGGKSPYTYLYSNGTIGQKACCLTGGTYIYVTATDANGCKGTGYASIVSSTPITVTYAATPSSCTAPTGSSTLNIKGGTKPYKVVWNTYPVQTGITVNNMNPGTVAFKVTDSTGCMQTGSVIIPPQGTVNASLSAENIVCPAKTGSVFVNAQGTNPPFTYAWNTGETKQQLLDVAAGSYFCKITDAIGCSVTKYKELKIVSTMNIGLVATDASCLYRNDGTILANAYGGTPPYTYKWSNGQTGNLATGLAKGYYYIYAVDSNGCTKDNHTTVGYNAKNDSCYCTVTGKVYLDQNSNCVYDSGEKGIEHIMIHCKGFGYTYTDANGVYSFLLPSGTYTFSESVQSVYPLADCQNNSDTITVTASHGCVKTLDFANIINPLHDISIITTSKNSAVRGYNYTQSVIVQNYGTITESNIQLIYQHDGQLQYTNTNPDIYTQPDPVNKPNLYNVTTGFPSLAPGASIELLTNYLVPVNVPLGTTINFADTVVNAPPFSNWLNDYSPWNNVNSFSTSVLGSFDPNSIEVLPKGKGIEGFIKNSDSVLTYTIHFQNTGSYYAQKIVLIDTLDKNLDINTLKPGYSDHNYTADVSESGVLKFTFDNIYLTWQSQSEAASNGLVTFTIKHKPNLAMGTKINNTASVIFDFNTPVATNTALNTLNNNAIKGILTYDDVKNTPLSNVKLYLKNTENLIIDSAKTDTAGNYVFYYMPNGDYTIEGKSSQKWAGGNPTDALLVNRYYIKLFQFSDDLLKLAADVNIDKVINPIDALLINRRYIKIVNSFKSGDWIFRKDIITVNNGKVIKDIKAVYSGDVNASGFSK